MPVIAFEAALLTLYAVPLHRHPGPITSKRIRMQPHTNPTGRVHISQHTGVEIKIGWPSLSVAALEC